MKQSIAYLPIAALLCMGFCNAAVAQTVTKYNLKELFEQHKLSVAGNDTLIALTDGAYTGVTCSGQVWLNDVNFSTGSIDADIRGRDVFQQSFAGIAFHGVNNTHYEAIYFRPFNFQSSDMLRRKHQVQYMYEPDYPWDRLRNEHPLVYENAVTPSLKAAGWFHAHIVVTSDSVIVYVDHSKTPSLSVKRLNNTMNGRIALWQGAYAGDFANLVITRDK